MSLSDDILSQVKYDSNGLIPVILQDFQTKKVLMLAYMNESSLKETWMTKKTHFWSRSRQKYWMKGESSGHIQHVKSMQFDCDYDTILIEIDQVGGASCHKGYESCFFRTISNEGNETVLCDPVFSPDDVY